jgi:hypothetical protein
LQRYPEKVLPSAKFKCGKIYVVFPPGLFGGLMISKTVAFSIIIEVRSKHPKFTIVSCDNLLINCVNRVVNKKSINELNVAE